MGTMSEATRSFLEVFKPRMRRYSLWDETAKPDDRGRKWRWQRTKLTEEIIEEAQQGVKLISFLCWSSTQYFGVDIDDHVNGGWLGDEPTNELIRKAEEAFRLVGTKPCAIFRSPHGLHAFWFFDKVLPIIVIQDSIEARLGKAFEFLPQYKTGIRMPTLADCIDEGFGKKDIRSFAEIRVDPYKEVFGEEAEPAVIKKWLKAHSRAVPMKRAGSAEKRIELEEQACPQFRNHASNESYCKLVGIYFKERLPETEATERIMAFAARSPGYVGDLKNRGGAETRVHQSYANLKRLSDHQVEPEYLLRDPGVRTYLGKLTVKLGLEHKTAARRRLERFIGYLKAWVDFVDGIGRDYELRAYWTHVYPGFAKYYKEGYLPVPSSNLKKWNSHYTDFFDDLVDAGVLKESPHSYSSHGRCKFFVIDAELRSLKVERHGE
jgi:hypothetical protein